VSSGVAALRASPGEPDQYLWWQIAEYGFDTFQIRTRTRA